MFKLIVLLFTFSGSNAAPVILNEYQHHNSEHMYFSTEKECHEKGQNYLNSFANIEDIRTKTRFVCVKVN